MSLDSRPKGPGAIKHHQLYGATRFHKLEEKVSGKCKKYIIKCEPAEKKKT